MRPFFYSLEQKKVILTEGSESSFSCKLLYGGEGNQAVSFNWLLNGVVLNNVPNRIKILNDMKLLYTRIELKLVGLNDKGVYQCMASNDYGNRTESIELVVKSQLAPLWLDF